MTQRPEQIVSLIRRAVQAELLRGVNDPRVRGLVSVTKVTVDPDLGEARIFISVLPAEHEKLTMAGLQSGAIHLQRKIRADLPLRRMPHLRFVLDDSLKKAADMERAVKRGVGDADPPPERDADDDSHDSIHAPPTHP